MAHLNRINPHILNHLLNRPPLSRIRLEHLPNERATRPRAEVIDRRGARRHMRVRARRVLDSHHVLPDKHPTSVYGFLHHVSRVNATEPASNI